MGQIKYSSGKIFKFHKREEEEFLGYSLMIKYCVVKVSFPLKLQTLLSNINRMRLQFAWLSG